MEITTELIRDALGVGAWACLGVSIRYWLAVMSDFDGFPGFPDLCANLFGTMLLGFATSHKNFLSRSPPTSVGITTGLCGSITTFSSWQFWNAIVFAGWLDYTPWENVLISITNQIVGVSACLSAFLLGRHLAMASPKNNDRVAAVEGEQPKAKMEFYIYLGILIIAACFSLLLGFFSNFSRLDFFFSIFFAPLGAMTRWGVSLVLNKAERYGDYYLPYGTLAVNITGILLLAMIEVVRQENFCFTATGELIRGGIAAGFGTGFCGCLTTVSTWISELHTLSITRGYFYGLLSIGLAQLLLLIILGGYRFYFLNFTQKEWEVCP